MNTRLRMLVHTDLMKSEDKIFLSTTTSARVHITDCPSFLQQEQATVLTTVLNSKYSRRSQDSCAPVVKFFRNRNLNLFDGTLTLTAGRAVF